MGIIGISRILTTISSIILIPVLTKNLGAFGYGLWSQAFATVSLSLIVFRLGFDLSIPRLFPGKEIKKIREDLYSILILVILVTGIFSVTLYLFPDILANAIFEGNVLIVEIVAIIIFVSCLDMIFLSVFQAFREMKKLAIINVISSYTKVGLTIFLVILGYGLIGAILAVLIVRASVSIVLYYLIRERLPFKKPNFPNLKEYLSLGLPTIPAAMSHLVVDVTDRYIIGFFWGATFVGYYTPSYALGKIVPTFLGSLLAFILLPSLSDYYEDGNISMVKQLLSLSTKYFLLISIPSFIGIIIVGRQILVLFTTPEIAQEGYNILVLTALVGILVGIYNIHKNSIFLEKKTKLIGAFWGAGATINLIGNIIFVPRIGIIAAAITTIISYLLVTSLVLSFSFKKFSNSFNYLTIGKMFLSAILMSFVLSVFHRYIWTNPFFLISLGIIIYFPTLYFLGGIKKEEIDFLRSFRK